MKGLPSEFEMANSLGRDMRWLPRLTAPPPLDPVWVRARGMNSEAPAKDKPAGYGELVARREAEVALRLKRQSELAKARWADPAMRAKMLAGKRSRPPEAASPSAPQGAF